MWGKRVEDENSGKEEKKRKEKGGKKEMKRWKEKGKRKKKIIFEVEWDESRNWRKERKERNNMMNDERKENGGKE